MNNLKMKPGELYRLKEDISLYDQPHVSAGTIFRVLEIRGGFIIDFLVGEHKYTWDTWAFAECVEKVK